MQHLDVAKSSTLYIATPHAYSAYGGVGHTYAGGPELHKIATCICTLSHSIINGCIVDNAALQSNLMCCYICLAFRHVIAFAKLFNAARSCR
jgi:hypothetical protein